MREYSASILIQAPCEHVWSVLSDIRRWPEWTPTVTSAEPLQEGPLNLHSRVFLRQPRLRPATWTVTRWDPPSGFTWSNHSPGITVTGDHSIQRAPGGCQVRLGLRFDGWLSLLLMPLIGRVSRDYLQQEIQGLKARCERP